MRIQHNITAMNSYRQYGINNSALGKSLEKLSSGYKINRAGDDAAGLAVSEKMRAQISALEGAQKNVKDGISMIQTAEGALQEVNDMLNRMYSLAEQSANGVYAESDRKSLDMEVQALKTEIDRIGKSANFNGMLLFSTAEDSETSADSNIFGGGIKFAIDDMGIAQSAYGFLTLTWSEITETIVDTLEYAAWDGTALTTGALGIEELNILSVQSATSAMHMIKDVITVVSAIRGKLGAYQNRLEHTANNLGVMRENMQDAESTIRDTDMAEEMMAFTKNSILNQASQAMLAQANQLPQGVLQLLQ